MVDLNSLCTFVLGDRGVGMGGFKTKQKRGAKPFIHSTLSILACVFRQISVGGGGGSTHAWKMLKTCKHEKFFLSFCKILSQNKASLIQAMVSCSEYGPLCSDLLLFSDN